MVDNLLRQTKYTPNFCEAIDAKKKEHTAFDSTVSIKSSCIPQTDARWAEQGGRCCCLNGKAATVSAIEKIRLRDTTS